MEHDNICRFIFEDIPVRGEIVRLQESYQTAITNHHYPTDVGKLLGEALAAVTLLCETMKFEGRLIIQTQSDGFVDPLVVQCNHQRWIRGIAKYSDQDPLQLPLLGSGQLAITILPNNTTERYQGIVNINPNGLASTLEDYFRQSEQLNTRIWLFANKVTAGGLLLQEIPSENKVDNTQFEHLTALADTLRENEMLNLDFATILHRLFVNEPIRLFAPENVTFHCTCDFKKMVNAISTLGKTEAEAILTSQQTIDVTCEFCNRNFAFDKSEVEQIFCTH